MIMLKKLVDLYAWSYPWRNRFGTIAGLRIALAIRQAIWAAPENSQVKINIPELPKPIILRAGTSDPAVFEQVFIDRQAEFPVPCEPSVIVDAGANIGLTAIIFANRYPNAKILALEIDRHNFELLQENTKHYSNITPVMNGLWSKKTKINILNPDASSWSFQAIDNGETNENTIPAVGVKDILKDYSLSKIDLLKMDIEGGEMEIFENGVDDWINQVDMIAVEVHDRFRPGCTETIRKALRPHNFQESRWLEYLLFNRG